MRYFAWCFLICAPVLSAQTFSFGVKGGGLFTDPAERLDESRRYVLGPSIEVGFSPRLAVEVNALYTRFGSSAFNSGVRLIRGNLWEFPVLGKYHFSDRESAIRPYASSGFAFRNIWLDGDRSDRVNSTEPAIGAVFGGGIAFKAGPFSVAPEIRYTRWGGFNFPATNANQVQALLGVTF
jgi:outer membrane protein W